METLSTLFLFFISICVKWLQVKMCQSGLLGSAPRLRPPAGGNNQHKPDVTQKLTLKSRRRSDVSSWNHLFLSLSHILSNRVSWQVLDLWTLTLTGAFISFLYCLVFICPRTFLIYHFHMTFFFFFLHYIISANHVKNFFFFIFFPPRQTPLHCPRAILLLRL